MDTTLSKGALTYSVEVAGDLEIWAPVWQQILQGQFLEAGRVQDPLVMIPAQSPQRYASSFQQGYYPGMSPVLTYHLMARELLNLWSCIILNYFLGTFPKCLKDAVSKIYNCTIQLPSCPLFLLLSKKKVLCSVTISTKNFRSCQFWTFLLFILLSSFKPM